MDYAAITQKIGVSIVFVAVFATVTPVLVWAEDSVSITNSAHSSSNTGGNTSQGSAGADGESGRAGQDGRSGAAGANGAVITTGAEQASASVSTTYNGESVEQIYRVAGDEVSVSSSTVISTTSEQAVFEQSITPEAAVESESTDGTATLFQSMSALVIQIANYVSSIF